MNFSCFVLLFDDRSLAGLDGLVLFVVSLLWRTFMLSHFFCQRHNRLTSGVCRKCFLAIYDYCDYSFLVILQSHIFLCNFLLL